MASSVEYPNAILPVHHQSPVVLLKLTAAPDASTLNSIRNVAFTADEKKSFVTVAPSHSTCGYFLVHVNAVHDFLMLSLQENLPFHADSCSC